MWQVYYYCSCKTRRQFLLSQKRHYATKPFAFLQKTEPNLLPFLQGAATPFAIYTRRDKTFFFFFHLYKARQNPFFFFFYTRRDKTVFHLHKMLQNRFPFTQDATKSFLIHTRRDKTVCLLHKTKQNRLPFIEYLSICSYRRTHWRHGSLLQYTQLFTVHFCSEKSREMLAHSQKVVSCRAGKVNVRRVWISVVPVNR